MPTIARDTTTESHPTWSEPRPARPAETPDAVVAGHLPPSNRDVVGLTFGHGDSPPLPDRRGRFALAVAALLGGLAALLLMPPTLVSAQPASGLTLHAAVGYEKMTDSGPIDALGIDPPGGSVGFALGGTWFAPIGLGLGAEVGYHLLGTRDDIDLPGNNDGEITYSLIPVTAQGYFRFVSESTIVPWVTVGLGSYTQRAESKVGGAEETENESRLGWNIGGGIDLRPADGGMGFGLDGRYHSASNEGPIDDSRFFTLAVRLYLDQMFE